MNRKRACPLCERLIESWESLCRYCWPLVQEHDRLYGTRWIEIFKVIRDTPNRKRLIKELKAWK